MKRLIFLPIFFLALIVGSPGYSEHGRFKMMGSIPFPKELDEGLHAHESGDYQTAMEKWLVLASPGNMEIKVLQ